MTTYAIYVTERIINSYEFDSKEEAEEAFQSGDFWAMEHDQIDGEVIDTQLVLLP